MQAFFVSVLAVIALSNIKHRENCSYKSHVSPSSTDAIDDDIAAL